MISTIYIENAVSEHPRTKFIVSKFSGARYVSIDRYGEVFNRRNQSFRVQKTNPALILAKKYNNFLLKTPEGFGLGGENNYYFSHMFNCIYDCRYCFLQGMYNSAHFVLFVNYEDFNTEIENTICEHKGEEITFFSGYDCDSLALESVTGFVNHLLPVFKRNPAALLELRTKSIQVKSLLDKRPLNNCVVAFSLMPHLMASKLDAKAPSIVRRIETMSLLAQKGWKIGLRVDPLIHGRNWKKHYKEFLEDIFNKIPKTSIHSVSFGPLRFPKKMFKKVLRMHSKEPIYAGPFKDENGFISYSTEVESEMTEFCREISTKFIADKKIFHCLPTGERYI